MNDFQEAYESWANTDFPEPGESCEHFSNYECGFCFEYRAYGMMMCDVHSCPGGTPDVWFCEEFGSLRHEEYLHPIARKEAWMFGFTCDWCQAKLCIDTAAIVTTPPPEVHTSTTPWDQKTAKAEWSHCADADTSLTMSLLETTIIPMPLQPTPPPQMPPPPPAEKATGAVLHLTWATSPRFPAGQQAAEAVPYYAMNITPPPMPPPTSATLMATGVAHKCATMPLPPTSIAPMVTGAIHKGTTMPPPTSATPHGDRCGPNGHHDAAGHTRCAQKIVTQLETTSPLQKPTTSSSYFRSPLKPVNKDEKRKGDKRKEEKKDEKEQLIEKKKEEKQNKKLEKKEAKKEAKAEKKEEKKDAKIEKKESKAEKKEAKKEAKAERKESKKEAKAEKKKEKKEAKAEKKD